MANNKRFNNLILIGGGIMRRGETEKIDRWMLEKVRNNKKIKTPKVLFIPAASEDLEEYVQDFTKRYQDYGAVVTTLFLIKGTPSQVQVRESFISADLIYFGGGDANLLLDTFTKFNLRPACIKAIKNNSIISGLSAGAIIWGSKFLTFDRSGNKFINFKVEDGLGWVGGLIIPHFNPTMLKNKKILKLLKSNLNLNALALGEGTAAYWKDNPIPFFKKQRRLCWGVSLPIKDLIQTHE